MYNDYPTIYESTTNENLIYWIILGIILLILFIICFVSLSKIYKKANRSAISAWVPIYNLWVLLEIVNLSKLYFILLFVPILNIWIMFQITKVLATSFRKGKTFSIGLLLLPFIFYPILAFSDSEYIGINRVAMEGKSKAVDIPDQVEQQESPTVHEEVDEASRNINISIGGGVYQKDYTNTLLQVDEGKTISTTNTENNIQQKHIMNFSKPAFINPIMEEETPVLEEEPKEMSILFPEQSEKPKEIESVPEIIPTPIIEPTAVAISNPIVSEPTAVSNPISTQTMEPNINIQPTTNSQTTAPSLDYIVCPKCGTKVKGDAKTCFLCGNTLN